MCVLPREDNYMHRFLILSVLALGTTLLGAAVARADDRNHNERRYYDRDRRDYHRWNGDEDRAYRIYLQEQHRDYRGFDRERQEQRRHYFRWRHDHPNGTLFKLEVR